MGAHRKARGRPGCTEDFSAAMKVRWIDVALAERLRGSGTDAFRVAEGPGLFIERFGPAVLISHAGPCPDPESVRKHPACSDITSIFARKLVRAPKGNDLPRRIFGSGPTAFAVQENRLLFEVDFHGGYSCGLFLDQRENRSRLRAMRPRKVLNLFAYTCSFSVAAASAGAETLSVDLSKSSLARGRQNFAINNLPTDGHRFVADDAFDFLPRLARRGEVFDAVILDPPTFSRGRSGRVFRAERDLPALLRLTLPCVAPGGFILLSTNCSRISPANLAEMSGNLPVFPAPRPPDIRGGASAIWIQNSPKVGGC